MSLRARTLASARWSVVRIICINSLQLVQVGLLARLLEPAHFGAMAIVVTVLALADVATQTGMEMVIVRERETRRDLLDAAWSLQCVRGLLLALLVLVVAAPVSAFQESRSLFALLAVAALVPAIDGLRNVGPVLYARDLTQAPLVLSETAVTIVSTAFSVAIAWLLRSPWALVANLVFFTSLKCVVSYWIHAWRPRFTFRWSPLRSALRFGFYANLALVTGYLLVSADKFLVGRAFGEDLLGLYDRAFLLSNIAALHLPRFLAAAVFPSFSKLKEHPARFRVYARRYAMLLAAGFAAGTVFLYVAAPRVIALIYGAKFSQATRIFEILLLHGCFLGIASGIHALFLVLDRPRLCFFANAAHLATFLTLLPFALRERDLGAVAWAMAAGGFVGLVTTVGMMWRGALKPAGDSHSAHASVPAPAKEGVLAGS